MHHILLLTLGLLLAVSLLVILAERIKVAYPIFLVIAGLGISFIPGMPVLHLNPDLIFLIFLPPLLYDAAWNNSWKDLWKWKRPILFFAFGLVLCTSTVVAYASAAVIPGLTLALGFLLGGIVSPPDAVAAASVMKNMPVPKRIMTILEGESLVNDASSLIIFKFALVAVLTGTFSMQEAGIQFFVVAGMGILIGLVGAHLMYFMLRFLPTNHAIDTAFTIITPYVLFVTAESFEYSGVMAVVSAGLFMSYRNHDLFRSGNTRLNMHAVWSTMIFFMNALVFILIGLELPAIVEGLGDIPIDTAIYYGLAISLVIILFRFLLVYPTVYIPRIVSERARQDPSTGWKGPFILSWAGMRGVVSLATALSIPVLMNDGTPFPYRSLIIFITFVVIFVTLVFQGLTLPFVIKLLNLKEVDIALPEDQQLASIQLRLNEISLLQLKNKYAGALEQNDFIRLYAEGLEAQSKNALQRIEENIRPEDEQVGIRQYHHVIREINELQKDELSKIRKENRFSDEVIRKVQLQLDLNDIKYDSKH
jgi:Na+/H+ antiporter